MAAQVKLGPQRDRNWPSLRRSRRFCFAMYTYIWTRRALGATVMVVLMLAASQPALAQGGSPPAAPARPTVDSVSHDSVTITWADPGDSSITGYQALRRNPAIHDPGEFEAIEDDTGSAATSYTDTDVEPETKYVYRVKARNAHGLSGRSGYVSTTTPAAPDLTPARPARPTLVLVSHNFVSITWTDPEDSSITGYQVLRRNAEIHDPGEFVVIEDDTGSSDTSYEDTDVEAETRYAYKVKARNAHGLSSTSQLVRATTPTGPALSTKVEALETQVRNHNTPLPWVGHGDLHDIETNLTTTFSLGDRERWYRLDSLAADSVHYFNHINRNVGLVTLEIYDDDGDPVMLNGSAVEQDKYLYFMPETAGDYRLRVSSDSNGYTFVKYRNETPNGSRGDRSGNDCNGNEYVGTNCRIASPGSTIKVEGRAHDRNNRRQIKTGQADQDYDVYKLFLRQGTEYQVCVDSTEDGFLGLWVTGLGSYSSAFKATKAGDRGYIPTAWWVESTPVCTNVTPNVTGPHWLCARVGEIHKTVSDVRSVVADTALNNYQVYYELR